MYVEQVLDLGIQLMKNGGKNKSGAFIILVSVVLNEAKTGSRVARPQVFPSKMNWTNDSMTQGLCTFTFSNIKK